MDASTAIIVAHLWAKLKQPDFDNNVSVMATFGAHTRQLEISDVVIPSKCEESPSICWDVAKTTIEAYLVRGAINAMIYTGPPQSSLEVMAAVLKSHDLAASDISLILNTHGHIDHIGGNSLVQAASQAKIFIHESHAFFLEDHALSFDRFYAAGIQQDLAEQKAG